MPPFLLLLLLLISGSAFAGTLKPASHSVPGEVLVKIADRSEADAIHGIAATANADKTQKISALKTGALWRLHSRSMSTEALATALAKNPNIEYVEPNYLVHLAGTPSDPQFIEQWALKNTGQSTYHGAGTPGTPGADIDATEAWEVTTGSASIVVGVVDSGIDYNHPDLAANVWSNPGGKGNAACAAGTHGFNAVTMTCDPMDTYDHGTAVSGVIGAVGNNGIGITGINWTTSIMGLKFTTAYEGTIADVVVALDFAVQAKLDGVNVRVLSNSYETTNFSKALLEEINKINENDILFVAAAGDGRNDNDVYPTYPASFVTPNIISVTSTDDRDQEYYGNYGLTSVDLGAPGMWILSTGAGNDYRSWEGTSMAAPHVSGVAALVLSKWPERTAAEVKSAILDNTDPLTSLAGKTVTGGRLNAAAALGVPPPPDFVLSVTPASRSFVPGETLTFTVKITPRNGFNLPVALSVDGLPPRATALFNPTLPMQWTLLIPTHPTAQYDYYEYRMTITAAGGEKTHTADVLLWLSRATPPPPTCPYFAPKTYSFVSSAVSITIADVNRDAKPDIAAANFLSNNVAVLLGKDDGSLQDPLYYGTGAAPVAIAAGDLNGDGKPDLVTANSASDDVSVLLGNGEGTFQAAVNYAAGTSPFAVATADFDGDGNDDLAVADNGDNRVAILIGDGTGAFAAPMMYATASGPYAIAAADFNRDGNVDLAVAAHAADEVSILMGNGDGTFAAAVGHATGSGPSSIAAADLNGDGRTDLAISNDRSGNVSVFIGNGDGAFAPPVHYATGDVPTSVAVADVDVDGHADLLVANNEGGTISILTGTGAGTLASPINYNVAQYPVSAPLQAIAGDFNSDGRPDLVYVSLADDSNHIIVALNDGVCSMNCGVIAPPVDYATGTTPVAAGTADFDRDGKTDLAVANADGNTISILRGEGNGHFVTGVAIDAGTSPDAVATGDFNGDGKPDLAVANGGSDDVSIFLGNGDASFQSPARYAAGLSPSAIVAADLDHDGKLDLAVANGGSNDVSILLGNGNGTWKSAVAYGAHTAPSGLACADFNRDGKLDLVVANSGSDDASILLGNGDGTFRTPVKLAAGAAPSSVAAGDFNRDGIVDFAVSNRGANTLSVFLGKGNGTFQPPAGYEVGLLPAGLAAADFTGDGIDDVAVANSGSHDVSILASTGTGTFRAPVNAFANIGPAAIVVADFNRDQKLDLAAANTGSSNISILLNTCPVPDLTVTKTHSGNFAQGSTGLTYTITVTNSGGGATTDLVLVKDTLPDGLKTTAISGAGWTCGFTGPPMCTRSDILGAYASYPPITVTVDVAAGAPSPVTNTVTVSGGGELNLSNNTASDSTPLTLWTALTVTSSHTGNFKQGTIGRTYTLAARNLGGLPTNGTTVTVADALPAGLIATAISGNGWNCTLASLTCTRSDVLAARSGYPPITVTVDVAIDALYMVTNVATISGGGDGDTADNTSSDDTVIWSKDNCGLGFSSGTGLSVPSKPRGVVTADFNGDHEPDIAVTVADKLSVFLSKGDGTFAAPVTYPAGVAPLRLVAADMNNDHVVDLVTAIYDTGVSIHLGNGDGTFQTARTYFAGLAIEDFTTGDLNGDGNTDVVVARYSCVSILLGNGDGVLQPAVDYTVTDISARTVAIGDFNSDEHADLLVGGYWKLIMFAGNGDGTLRPFTTIADDYSRVIGTGDFNGDGKIDIAAAGSSRWINVFLSNGDGTFTSQSLLGAQNVGLSILINDFDGDGALDMIAASMIFFGKGDGTFEPGVFSIMSEDVGALADFDHDGKPDLVTVYRYSNYLMVRLSRCPELAITKTHPSDFAAGLSGVYTIVVRNLGGSSRGPVTVTDTLPAPLTATAISGSGWDCTLASLTCTRDDSLPEAASYPPITLTVATPKLFSGTVTNTATLSGGSDSNPANNTATDPTSVVMSADLVITKTHNGVFTQGQSDATYTITIGNNGGLATSGPVNVHDSPPYELTITSMFGTGWTCDVAARSCSRSDALAPTATYPPVSVIVTVNNTSTYQLVNTAWVSGSGDNPSSNNTATDVTAILTTPGNLIAVPFSTSQISVVWNPSWNATGYQIWRSVSGGAFTMAGTPTMNGFIDSNLQPNTAYAYKVRATNGLAVTAWTNVGTTATFAFSDDPIVIRSTKIKGMHIMELRSAINAMRATAGLPVVAFTDPSLTRVRIQAVHINELRTRLDEARLALGLPAMTYTDPTLSIRMRIKAAHITELREGVPKAPALRGGAPPRRPDASGYGAGTTRRP